MVWYGSSARVGCRRTTRVLDVTLQREIVSPR
jgi:hypothetical protein